MVAPSVGTQSVPEPGASPATCANSSQDNLAQRQRDTRIDRRSRRPVFDHAASTALISLPSDAAVAT